MVASIRSWIQVHWMFVISSEVTFLLMKRNSCNSLVKCVRRVMICMANLTKYIFKRTCVHIQRMQLTLAAELLGKTKHLVHSIALRQCLYKCFCRYKHLGTLLVDLCDSKYLALSSLGIPTVASSTVSHHPLWHTRISQPHMHALAQDAHAYS